MGHDDILCDKISRKNKNKRHKVLEDHNKKSTNYHNYIKLNEYSEVEYENESSFYRRNSLNEDFLCFNVTTEGK